MIVGIGIDSIEVPRVARQLEEQAGLMEQLFTAAEIAHCAGQRHPERHFAARFAAKEAYLKALGTGWRGGIRFSDIEVISGDSGAPDLAVTGEARRQTDRRGIIRCRLALSVPTTTAAAMVILEK